MIYRTSKENIDAYFASPIISQSRLKLLPKGVDIFNDIASDTESEIMFYEERSYFILGQAAELKAQQGSEVFDQTYHLSEVAKPGDKTLSVIHQVFDIQCRIKEPTESFPLLSSLREDIQSAVEFHEYQTRWKMDTRIDKIISEGELYYQDLCNAQGKQVLSLDEVTITNSIVQSWTTHPKTAKYFREYKNIDYYYQLPIYFTYKGIEFKALLDILEVDHVSQTITPIDLKTLGGYTIGFPGSLRKLRYDFQGAFYCIAASHWKRQGVITRMDQTGEYLANYYVMPPKFIVETTRLGKQGNPLVFELSLALMDIALFGRKLFTEGQHYDDRNMLIKQEIQTAELYGINDAIELYRWHLENGFTSDKIVAEVGHGALKLDWEGVVK